MMNIIEEAIIYSTIMHQGKLRKYGNRPYILHPMEVAQILSQMTDDQEIITAGILHDVVEDTDGTLGEIEKRFGKRVAALVSSESEKKYPEEDPASTWKRRKEESLAVLRKSEDIGVRMLWLADKLANIRSLAAIYSEKGEEIWQRLNQTDPAMQRWYYKSIGEIVELDLNKTGAFKEFIKHINSIWPGTFDSDKSRYKKYKEASVEGCELLGKGFKGDVYRYNDELVIKVFNNRNTYSDVEREIAIARRAFILGVPTAISFGIVSVGNRYGTMVEIVDSQTVSQCIAKSPGQVKLYAQLMAGLAHTIHSIEVSRDDVFPDVSERLVKYIEGGVAKEDEKLGQKCLELVKTASATDSLLHGDFHTGNVFLQKGEPMLIDMDRVSVGHPIAEIADVFYFYIVRAEGDPESVEKFMGFSYKTAEEYFHRFLEAYLDTTDQKVLDDVIAKASVISYSRKIRMLRKKDDLTAEDKKIIEDYTEGIRKAALALDSLAF